MIIFPLLRVKRVKRAHAGLNLKINNNRRSTFGTSILIRWQICGTSAY